MAPARFLGEDRGIFRIEVPNATFANRIEGEFQNRILEALRSVGFQGNAVRCEVADETESSPGNPSRAFAAYSLPISDAYGFETFVVGAQNRCAHAAALAVSDVQADKRRRDALNPLLIYGAPGLGKTHLLQSIARRLLARTPDLNILFTKGEAFTRQVVQAVRSGSLYDFRDRCATLDVLLVDDLQFIAGLDRFSRSTEEFFHTLNALSERGRQIVLTANSHPQEVENLDDRIKSRLASGLAADIGHPDRETRVAIVTRKAALLDFPLSEGAAEQIADHYRNNVRQLEGALKRLIALSGAESIPVSRELVARAVASPLSGPPRRPSLDKILVTTATMFGVPLLHLRSRRRSHDLSLARHAAMYLCREVTHATLQEIGNEFRRDHSSVSYGVRRIQHQRSRDPGLEEMLQRVLRTFD